MNPHQNNPYNPQNNGYPQQAGPNKYPTLPPVQNPQYPQNPQNPQYPPQQPQYPGYNAQARPVGYQPPAQYGNVQAGNQHNEERQALVMKIKELDDGFNTCFMSFYKVWLWILAISGTIVFVSDFVIYVNGRNISNLSDYIVISFLLMLWNATQAMFGLKAISEKSLKKANITCWMLTLVLIPWLILEFFLLFLVVNYQHGGKYDWFAILAFVFGVVTLVVVIHIGVSMNGAFKVRKILIDREILQAKLNEIDYSFRA